MGSIVLKEYQETPDVLITYLLVYPDSGIDKLEIREITSHCHHYLFRKGDIHIEKRNQFWWAAF